MFYKMDVLELQNSQEHQWRGFLFYETALLLFAVSKSIKKENLAQLSSYEFCEIFKKTFLIEHRCFYIKLVIDFDCGLQLGI